MLSKTRIHRVSTGGESIGSQRQGGKYEDLSFEAKQNDDCNKLSGKKVRDEKDSAYVQEVDDSITALVWCSEGGITGDPYQWIKEQEAKEVVMKRLRMSTKLFDKVDWVVRGAAFRRIATTERIMVTRILSEEFSTVSKLERNGYRKDETCALCEGTDNKKHFLECGHLNATEERRVTLGGVKGKLEKLNVDPYLTY